MAKASSICRFHEEIIVMDEYVYINDDIQNGIASSGFANIRVKEPTTILSKYLYYIMTSDYISDDLHRSFNPYKY
jgi:restriction endonuclease S subunit